MNPDIPKSVELAYLDTETTGLEPEAGHRICEIAIVRTQNGKVVNQFSSLVNPGRGIPSWAQQIHGITDEMVREAPYFGDIAMKVNSILDGAFLVAHNAAFDVGFLDSEFSKARLPAPQTEIIDTLKIARKYYDFPSNSLEDIAKKLGIDTAGNHRALADVMITKRVFEYFLLDLGKRKFDIAAGAHDLKFKSV
ncbi:MAG: 3'-5' exonuclease [Candidatus Dadabacteria bacterium]|nr:3'-5' exonuclease [Candidatus Dadabacteria bacterium]